MKHWLSLLFILVQVGSMTYVNPDCVIAVQSAFGTRTAIELASGKSGSITVYSDWPLETVVKVLRSATSK